MSRREPLPPRGERAAQRRERWVELLRRLDRTYPGATCALAYDTPFQLLVATILSAQCTDARVNLATPALFARFPDAQSMAGASEEELEELVRPTGFYRQKSRNLLRTARRIVDEYGGETPSTLAELTTLPGAARKTANVVISNCFPEHAEGIAVDTHVQRVSRRLGLTREYDPERIERDLLRITPRERWNDVTHLLIDHGRATCQARSPRCDECPLLTLCPASRRFTANADAGSGTWLATASPQATPARGS